MLNCADLSVTLHVHSSSAKPARKGFLGEFWQPHPPPEGHVNERHLSGSTSHLDGGQLEVHAQLSAQAAELALQVAAVLLQTTALPVSLFQHLLGLLYCSIAAFQQQKASEQHQLGHPLVRWRTPKPAPLHLLILLVCTNTECQQQKSNEDTSLDDAHQGGCSLVSLLQQPAALASRYNGKRLLGLVIKSWSNT